MPVSRVMAVAMSSIFAASPSPILLMYSARTFGVSAAHESKAPRAAFAASSTSAAPHEGIVAITDSSVESQTSMVSLVLGDTHWPLI